MPYSQASSSRPLRLRAQPLSLHCAIWLLSTWRTVYTLFHRSPPPTLLSALHQREETAEAVVSTYVTIKIQWHLGAREHVPVCTTVEKVSGSCRRPRPRGLSKSKANNRNSSKNLLFFNGHFRKCREKYEYSHAQQLASEIPTCCPPGFIYFIATLFSQECLELISEMASLR